MDARKLTVYLTDDELKAIGIPSASEGKSKTVHTLLLRDELRAVGCKLHYVTSGQTKNTPEGDLLGTMEAMIAEYERLKIAERMMRGKQGKIASGRILGHGLCTPYGYRHEG